MKSTSGNRLERRNIKVYTHRYTKGYPTDVELIVSDEAGLRRLGVNLTSDPDFPTKNFFIS